MKRILLSMVGGLPSEWHRIAALLTLGFFTGIFMASYSVSINALFISKFGNENDFPIALISQGLLGVFFTILFSKLQNIIGFRKLVYYTSILILLIIGSISLSLILLEENELVVFLGFATLGPIASISLLIFWGAFGRLFNFSQSKRLSGGIDTGQAVATILSFFSVPLIQKFLPSLSYLSIVGTISYLGCCIALFYILKKFKMHAAEALTVDKNKSKREKHGRVRLRDYKKYFFMISTFVMCSSFSAAFVDYSFVTVTPQYFLKEQELANFLAFFEAFVIIISFLVQTFLNDKILEVYGLQYSLMLLPGILVFFGVIDLVIGSLFGHSQQSEAFLMFFLIISMSKLVTDALRDSLENPTVKIFFFALPTEVRYEAQTLVEGTVAQMSTLGAGIVMIGISRMGGYNILYNNFVIFAIVALWVFITFEMYGQYRISLQNLLAANSTENEYSDEYGKRFQNNKIQNLLQNRWNSVSTKLSPILFKLIERLDVFLFRSILSDKGNLLRFVNKRIALGKINKYRIYESKNALNDFISGTFENDELIEVAQHLADDLKAEELLESNEENIIELSKSSNPQNRIKSARLIFSLYNEKLENTVSKLIRDYNYDVRVEAMSLVGFHKISNLIPVLVERLAIKGDERVALSAIVAVGEDGAKILENSFHKNGQIQQTKRLILQAYAKIGSEESVQLLADKITLPERRISYEALSLLSALGWNAEDEYHILFLKEALKRETSNCYWNIAVSLELEDAKETVLIQRAIQNEIISNYNQMFLLLDMLYDRGSLNLIRKNHELGTADSIGYSVELLDVLIDEDIKGYVLPLFEDASSEDRVKKLQELFYRETYTSDYALIRLATRDPNWLSSWARASALYALAFKPRICNPNILVGYLFDSNKLLSELAAWILKINFPDILEESYERLDQKVESELRELLRDVNSLDWKDTSKFIFSKALFFSNMSEFHGLTGDELSDLAEISTLDFYRAGKTITVAEKLKEEGLFIVKEGEIAIGNGDVHTLLYKKRTMIGTYISTQAEAWVGEMYTLKDSYVYRIDEKSFFLLLATDMHMVEIIMNNVRRSFRTSINLQKMVLE